MTTPTTNPEVPFIQTLGRDLAATAQVAIQAMQRSAGARAVLAEAVIPAIIKAEEDAESRHQNEPDYDDELLGASLAALASVRSRVQELIEQATANEHVARGQITGLNLVLQALDQRSRAEQQPAAEPVPQHPGPGLAAERKEAEASAPAADDAVIPMNKAAQTVAKFTKTNRHHTKS